MKIGVLTGGGPAPGLNAAIRSMVRRCENYGFEVVGIMRGWAGMLKPETVELRYENIRHIVGKGGTILKTSRTNPLQIPDGTETVIRNFRRLGLNALIAIGGDDTLSFAKKLSEEGLNIIGVPKTIDNDVSETDTTIGFYSAVDTAMQSIERLYDIADSMDRVVVVETMGRHAGWIALYSGLAAGADLILIPEEPFEVEKVISYVKRKLKMGQNNVVIVVSEGALVAGHKGPLAKDSSVDQFGHERLGGIGEFLAKEIRNRTKVTTRAVSPAHIVMGGPPTAFDRVMATRCGIAAVDLVKEKRFGVMVALRGEKIIAVPLEKALFEMKGVYPELYEEARIFFE